MASSAQNNACRICLGSLTAGQALFTAECSHCFHLSCAVSRGHRFCPLCNATWNNLPFSAPLHISSPYFQPHPLFRNQFPPPEPLDFSDDEPLADPTSVDSSLVASELVTIKAIPERPAVAAADSASPFAVLVALKAPSLSDEARRAPVDIVTVLDVSGSMAGIKLDLVKRAVHFVIDNLGVCDRLSVVSFSDQATRMLPLKRMTESGREEAKNAVSLLHARGGTNIVEGLRKGAKVLDERRHKNPVSTIIFLSDGNDTYSLRSSFNSTNVHSNLHLLPLSIFPRSSQEIVPIPVHSFGFGSDHDPITMHAISDASGGTFSFIESYEMVQDAFASCIGGLMSVVTHELCLKLRSASHDVEIKSIPSGRYKSEVFNQGTQGLINVGDLYADEEKEFLINLSIPIQHNVGEKTSLLDITCSYKDAASREVVEIESDLVEIKRPKAPTQQETALNIQVDRQRNRLLAAESIQQAQQMAEAGNLAAARDVLAKNRDHLMGSAAGKAGDGLVKWLEGEMKETEMRMGNARLYEKSGRAFAIAGISSHATQRETSRGSTVEFGRYATPQMASMVSKSREQTKEEEEGNTPKKD